MHTISFSFFFFFRHLSYKRGLAKGLPFTHVNTGGGLGTVYLPSGAANPPPSIPEWTQLVAAGVEKACSDLAVPLPHLLVEAGRCLVSASTVTLYTVGGTKRVPGVRTFVSIDGGLSDNLRPVLYKAAYQGVVANKMPLSREQALV